MLLSQAIDEQRVFNRVTYMPNILECRTGAFWILAHCRFYPGLLYTHAQLLLFYGFLTIFTCLLNFKHATRDMAE
jgi:hypothetical protein